MCECFVCTCVFHVCIWCPCSSESLLDPLNLESLRALNDHVNVEIRTWVPWQEQQVILTVGPLTSPCFSIWSFTNNLIKNLRTIIFMFLYNVATKRFFLTVLIDILQCFHIFIGETRCTKHCCWKPGIFCGN